MAIVTDEGLVLRVLRFRETSRIATVLTLHFGKVHVLAKGAREIRSSFGAALEILTRGEFVFYLKKNRDLHLLKSAAVREAHLPLLAQPRLYHLASAAAEFVSRVTPDEDPCAEVYGALADFWDAHAQGRGASSPDGGLRGFQLRVAAQLGYAPQLAACARCGRPLESARVFGVSEGGILCEHCPPEGEGLALQPDVLRRLRELLLHVTRCGSASTGVTVVREHSAATPAAPASTAVDRQLGRVLEAFLRFHITGYAGLQSLASFADWTRVSSREGVRKQGAMG